MTPLVKTKHQERCDRIALVLARITIPPKRCRAKPYYGFRNGNFEVGYSWSRQNSHFMTGLVYECVLGRGATYDLAMENMERKHVEQPT